MTKFIDFKNILSRINRWEIILVMGFLTPILIIFLIHPYVSSTDEKLQLEASINLITGNGYVINNVLTGQNNVYLSNWPIGYSTVIAILIKLGLPLIISAKIYKIFFLIIGFFLWYVLSTYFLDSLLYRIAFLSLLNLSTFRICFAAGTELTLWAFFALLSLSIINFNFNSQKIKSRLFYISIILSLFPLFKYVGIAVFIICFIWLLLSIGKQSKLFIRSFFFLFSLPIFITCTIFINNYINQSLWPNDGSYNVYSPVGMEIISLFNVKYIIQIVLPALFKAINAMMLGNFLLFDFIKEGFQYILFIIGFPTSFPHFTFLLAVGFFSISIYYSNYMLKKDMNNNYVLWLVSSFIGMYIFLFIVSFLFTELTSFDMFIPFIERRYYHWIYPLMLIFMLICIQLSFERKIIVKNVLIYIIIALAVSSNILDMINRIT